MSLLAVEDLVSGYGTLPVLHGVSLAVSDNEIVALIGPNGAGKTTLLKAVFGLLPTSGGTVSFADTSLSGLRVGARRQLGMSLVPQTGGTFPDLTVEDNLRVSYSALGSDEAEKALTEAYAMFPVLAERRRQSARTLSGGERQMLTFVSGIGGRPRLLALDEPTAGLAPTIVHGLMQAIVGYKNGGSAVLFVVEENPFEVLPYADRVYVLRAGVIQAEMPARDLLAQEDLEALFFGTGG
jgi:ABC-type branched-subunit amino acid transport system ATPase component